MENKLKTLLFIVIVCLSFFACKQEDPNCPDLDNSRINTENSRIGLYFRDSLGNNINHLVELSNWGFAADSMYGSNNRFNINIIKRPFVKYNLKSDTIVHYYNGENYCKYSKNSEPKVIYYFDSLKLKFANSFFYMDSSTIENNLHVFHFNIPLTL